MAHGRKEPSRRTPRSSSRSSSSVSSSNGGDHSSRALCPSAQKPVFFEENGFLMRDARGLMIVATSLSEAFAMVVGRARRLLILTAAWLAGVSAVLRAEGPSGRQPRPAEAPGIGASDRY